MNHERWEKIKKENPELHARYLQKMKDYVKRRLAEDPEYRTRRNEIARNTNKIRYATDPEYKERVTESHKEWVKNNREKYNEYQRGYWKEYAKYRAERINRNEICNILIDHGEELSDDPEHLPTDFIISLMNREDKKQRLP